MIDWTNCPDVERTPGKVSGAWCVKGRRIPVVVIIAPHYTAEQIAELYDLDVETGRRILRHAGKGP